MRGKGIVLLVLALLVPAGTTQATPSPDPGVHWESYLPDFPPAGGPQPYAVPGCARPAIGCIDHEIRTMVRVQKRLGCDHRGVFDTTYLVLTRALRNAVVSQPNLILHKRYLYYEDALFADYYFRTLRSYAAGRVVAPAWQIALDTARSADVNAAQDMLLGINAHVQNDMPFVLAALGLVTPQGASRKPDHDAVNQVLSDAYERVVEAVAGRFDPFVSFSNASWNPTDDIAGLEMVREWREQVWRNAERLVAARSDAERRQVGVEIQQNAAAWARQIATSAQPGYRATRDAYCASRLKQQR